MAGPRRRSALWLLAALAAGLLAIAWVGLSGWYGVGADDPHTRPVLRLLEVVRDRSVAARASAVEVPADLDDPARITQGAGNYAAMCMGCHLAPGLPETELSRGLYPAPPNLTRETVDAAEAFWVVKHGIKASGMPAWGHSMDDPYIWNLVAFIQALPGMERARFDALVESSGGHEHGGGETTRDADARDGMIEHRHPDGTVESHPVEPGHDEPHAH